MKIPTILFGIFLIFLSACSKSPEEGIVNNWSLKAVSNKTNQGELVFPVEDDSETWVFNHDGTFMMTVVYTHFGSSNQIGSYEVGNNKVTITYNNALKNNYSILKLTKNSLRLGRIDSLNGINMKYDFEKFDF